MQDHLMEDDSNLFYLNGVDSDGHYLSQPLTAEELFEAAYSELNMLSAGQQATIQKLEQAKTEPTHGWNAPLDDPAEAGWGVLIPTGTDVVIQAAVEKLVNHRAKRHGIQPKVIQLSGPPEYGGFLSDHNVSPGLGDVNLLPYYLLIIGSPQQVSFRFQYEMAKEYAVGRLAFTDLAGKPDPTAYQAYIDQLIDYDNATAVPNEKKAVFWGPHNFLDRATKLSSSLLIRPLYENSLLAPEFSRELYIDNDPVQPATKNNLVKVLTRPAPPALLFTASHGVGYRKIDPKNQLPFQGALLAQEWCEFLPTSPGLIYSGRDVRAGANVRGMVHFAFACNGAGTPDQGDYSYSDKGPLKALASEPFIADLPNAELAAGALAFIGHVDQAWGFSFYKDKDHGRTEHFQRFITNLIHKNRAWPVGHCLRDLFDRALHLSFSLLEDLHQISQGKHIDPEKIALKWKERNDARAYALIGDPAARVRVNQLK